MESEQVIILVLMAVISTTMTIIGGMAVIGQRRIRDELIAIKIEMGAERIHRQTHGDNLARVEKELNKDIASLEERMKLDIDALWRKYDHLNENGCQLYRNERAGGMVPYPMPSAPPPSTQRPRTGE